MDSSTTSFVQMAGAAHALIEGTFRRAYRGPHPLANVAFDRFTDGSRHEFTGYIARSKQ